MAKQLDEVFSHILAWQGDSNAAMCTLGSLEVLVTVGSSAP
jgi:hypothetical protein